MHFLVKMSKNGRKNIFREKETTNKVPLMLLDVKALTEREQLYYLRKEGKQGNQSVRKQGNQSVCI